MGRRANVGKACLNCRKRKAKCTGQPPSCQTCQLYNDECKWGEDDDGRKPASRQFVQSLKNRIKSLEAALEARGQLVPSPGDEGHDESDNEEEMVDRVSQAMLHLQVGDVMRIGLIHRLEWMGSKCITTDQLLLMRISRLPPFFVTYHRD